MAHLAYHQTSLALYLPYLLQSPQNANLKPLRDSCIASARLFLKTHHQLRHPSSPFATHCRALDAIVCTACIILLLSLWGFGGPGGGERDRDMIRISMSLLQTSSTEMSKGVTKLSYNALCKLTSPGNLDTEDEMEGRFLIPYFARESVEENFFPIGGLPKSFEIPPHRVFEKG
jgi:hypothetical protein